jgi:hypothetical protein
MYTKETVVTYLRLARELQSKFAPLPIKKNVKLNIVEYQQESGWIYMSHLLLLIVNTTRRLWKNLFAVFLDNLG